MDDKTAEYMEKRVQKYRYLQNNIEELERQKALIFDAGHNRNYLVMGNGNNGSAKYRKEPSAEFVEDLIKAIDAEIIRVKQEMEEI